LAAAVVLHPGQRGIPGVRDSKRLTPQERCEFDAEIRVRARAFAIGAASVREIDRLNILRATRLAMQRALTRLSTGLGEPLGHVVIDGLPVKGLRFEHDAVVGGDDRIHSIACASVLAKVCRDLLMQRLGGRYPQYGWETNAGYGTAVHRSALRASGPTPHHRISFGLEQLTLFGNDELPGG